MSTIAKAHISVVQNIDSTDPSGHSILIAPTMAGHPYAAALDTWLVVQVGVSSIVVQAILHTAEVLIVPSSAAIVALQDIWLLDVLTCHK